MIGPRRQGQTEAEYARELDTIIADLQRLTKSEGWKRYAGQLAVEMNAAWEKMCAADTVDKKALAAAEYAVLKRMLEAPDRAMSIASQTLAARPDKLPK